MRPEVVEAMLPYFTEQFGNPSSIYPLGQEAADAVAAARETLAGLIGAAPQAVLVHGQIRHLEALLLQGLAGVQHRMVLDGARST